MRSLLFGLALITAATSSAAFAQCDPGWAACGSTYCIPSEAQCCASAGHPSKFCSAGTTCTSSGTCSGGSNTGGGSGSGMLEGTPSWGCTSAGLSLSTLWMAALLFRRRKT